jgi:hypothetical protein
MTTAAPNTNQITGDVTNHDEVMGHQLKAIFISSDLARLENIVTRDHFVHVSQQTQEHPNCALEGGFN